MSQREKLFQFYLQGTNSKLLFFLSQKVEDTFDEGATKKAHWERKKLINK
jgi:hypothetical protein